MAVSSVDRLLQFASAAAFIFLGLLTTRAALAVEEISEGESILIYERSINLRPLPETITWSSDSRYLAAKGFADGRLRIIDTRDANAADRVILDGVGRASIAWSPDGRVVAVHQSGPSYGFRLLSVADAYEIGRWEVTQQQSDDGRCSSAAMPMAFTDDGKALWVTCRVSLRNVPVTFPVAVKHRLPDLVAEDRIELKTPIADAKASDTHYLLTRIGAKQSLSALIGYFVPGKTRYFSYAFDLEHKTEIFPHFETAGDTRSGLSRPPNQTLVLPDASFALVHLATTGFMATGTLLDEKFDRLFEGYDTRTSQRTVSYGGQGRAPSEAGAVGRVALLSDGHSVVGQWSRAAIREGGLVVFDARSGAVRQRVRFGETYQLALSPNGRRVATITAQGELRIYRINN